MLLRVVQLSLLVWMTAATASAQVVLPPNVGVPPRAETVPPATHDLALAALAVGDHAAALDLANGGYRGASRIGAERWIDSIAAAALVGECLFERGDYRNAVLAYEEAMLLEAGHPDWLLSVQFPPQAAPAARQRVATWGRSERNTMPGSWPEVATIRIRGADPQEVLQRGGVLAAPYDRSLRPQEIMRLLVIAIYRHAVLLGELGRENASLDAVVKALARRSAPPNHHSQAWLDVALGTAHWAQGKADLAQPLLVRGLVAGNDLDHPLTAWGLIVLGRIALDADQAARAAKFFEEASYAAADFGDARALEESMRLAFQAHRAAGVQGVPPSIRGCSEWAGNSLAALDACLLAAQAEALAAAGDSRSAAAALRKINGRLLSGDTAIGGLAAWAAYAAALADYAAGDVAAGDATLDRALTLAQSREPRLFQTTLLTELIRGGSAAFSDRQADALLSRLLADPGPKAFAVDPLGALALMTAARSDAFEVWVEVAKRRGDEAGLDAAEAAVRGRWLSAQLLGGRRLAVTKFLTGDPRLLAPADAARRAAVIAAQPGLAGLLDRVGQLRASLAAALPDRAKPNEWQEYRDAAAQLERIVAGAAAGREPAPLAFPPLTSAAEVRRRLPQRHLILSFHWTSAGLWAALESRERFSVWQVRQAAGLPKELEALARSLSLFDPVAPVSTERLLEGDWRGSAERIERMLFENSRITLAEGIDELVIVPDGWLWYLPFELLPVATNRAAAGLGAERRLRDVCRIRYCPTRSLAVMRFDPRPPGPIGVVAGRLFRGDRPAVADEAVAEMAATLRGVVPIASPPGPAPALVASVCDTLLVLDEIQAEGTRAGRPLVSGAAGRAGVTIAEWLGQPPKRPQRVLLPGLQTAMARGLAKPQERPGDEIFMTATDLLAAGSHTAVVSRWRVGGKSCLDLMSEFLRDATAARGEAPPSSAAASWQRAVDVLMAEQPDPLREPRLKASAGMPLPDGRHPFLWAGYMLVDCGSGAEAVEPAAAPPGAAAPARAAP